MTKKLIAFNWKMYPSKLKDVEGVLMAFDGVDVDLDTYEIAIAPPVVYLPLISEIFYELKADISLALQNCSWEREGALTGEVSAEMGKNFGVDYVIVGHSERRIHFGETDDVVNKKLKAVRNAKLGAIVCVGEPLDVRKRGGAAVKKHIRRQIEQVLAGIPLSLVAVPLSLTIAYEPIWAIGTGKPATAEDAVEIIGFIKETIKAVSPKLAPRVLYGGSVNSGNAQDFLQCDVIDGVLVGGASVDKKELKKILRTLSL